MTSAYVGAGGGMRGAEAGAEPPGLGSIVPTYFGCALEDRDCLAFAVPDQLPAALLKVYAEQNPELLRRSLRSLCNYGTIPSRNAIFNQVNLKLASTGSPIRFGLDLCDPTATTPPPSAAVAEAPMTTMIEGGGGSGALYAAHATLRARGIDPYGALGQSILSGGGGSMTQLGFTGQSSGLGVLGSLLGGDAGAVANPSGGGGFLENLLNTAINVGGQLVLANNLPQNVSPPNGSAVATSFVPVTTAGINLPAVLGGALGGMVAEGGSDMLGSLINSVGGLFIGGGSMGPVSCPQLFRQGQQRPYLPSRIQVMGPNGQIYILANMGRATRGSREQSVMRRIAKREGYTCRRRGSGGR